MSRTGRRCCAGPPPADELPVTRKPADGTAPITLKTMELLVQLDRSVHEANKVGGEFCLTDLDAAMTMLDRAEMTREPATRERNLHNAREAFDVVSRLAQRLALEPETAALIQERLKVVSERLRAATSGKRPGP